jgi:multiple sugar transport system substrate-binding protein
VTVVDSAGKRTWTRPIGLEARHVTGETRNGRRFPMVKSFAARPHSRRHLLVMLAGLAATLGGVACGTPSGSAATAGSGTGATSTTPGTTSGTTLAASTASQASASAGSTVATAATSARATSSATASSAAVSGTTAAQSGAPAGQGVALQVWQETLLPFDKDVGQQLTAPWLAANPGLSLQTLPNGNNQDKFLAAAAGGVPPDLFSTGSWEVQSDYVDGATTTLDQFIDRSKLVAKADLWPSLLLDVTFRGSVTGLPYAPDTRYIYTRTDQAQQAGLDPNAPPKTWSALQDAAQKAYKGSGATVQHVGWFPFWGSGGDLLWMVPYWQLGGELLNADNTKVTFVNDQAIQALNWLKRVVDLQGGWQGIDAFRKQYTTPSGEAIMMAGGTTYLHATLSTRGEMFKVQAPTMQFAISAYPLPDQGGVEANYGGCHTLVIAKGSKHQEPAWSFIENLVKSANNIVYADRYDLVPIRVADTSAPAYVKNDPARALQAQQMQKRRFVIPAPGAIDMLKYEDVVTPFMSGKLTVQESLQQMQQQAQVILDQNLAKAKSLSG